MTKPENKNDSLSTPLEYCRLDRAARLLGCEVSDLVHWGAIGAISICLKDPVIGKLTPSILGYWKSKFNFDLNEYLHSNFTVDISPYAYIANLDYQEKKEGELCFMGLWPLSMRAQTELERGDQIEGPYRSLIVATSMEKIVKKSTKLPLLIEVTISDDENISRDIENGNLWITRPDMELVHSAIKNRTRLSGIFDAAAMVHQIDGLEQDQFAFRNKIVHHSAERHAVNREAVLAAAINLKHKHPELCGDTARQWAGALEQYAHRYWDEGQPPLSLQKIEELLGSAMNSGMPHKKT